MSRIAQVITILALLASSFSLGGCNDERNTTNTAPTSPISVDMSFPYGAPWLNQSAELRCLVGLNTSADNVTLEVNLPEGLQLVSGDLSAHFETMSRGDVKELRAVIKPVKVGNYTIESKLALVFRDPSLGAGPGLHYIYLSVSENSAEWGIYPPWLPEKAPPPPVTPVPPAEAPSGPIKVKLSLPYAPAVNETIDITCTVSSIIDAQNTTVIITSSRRLTSEDSYNMARPYVVSDNVTQTLNLKANQPVSFSASTVFKEPGLWEIKAVASCTIDKQWTDKHTDKHQTEKHQLPGEFDAIYLTISSDKGELGWPRTGPVKVRQVAKGDIEGIPSTSEYEPPVEVLPKPPAHLPNGTLTQIEQHHSITVAGSFQFYWQAGDYRDNPNQVLPAKYFLVELCDANGNHKAYGYTNSWGDFSIPGVDPSGGIKARWWCYNAYSIRGVIYHELRVVDSGNSLTGLTDVWHTGYTSIFYWPDDGGAHSIGVWELQAGATGLGAWWIKDDLERAFRYPITWPGSGTAKWSESSTDGTYYDVGGQIHLRKDDKKAPDVVIHEYGHNVMYNVNSGYWPSGDCPVHDIPDASNLGCGWKEGWADFFPLAVNGNSVYTYTDGTPRDLEVPTWDTYGWDNGDTVEGRVAGTLWDIYDANTDGFDTYSDGFDEIWDTFSHQTDNTFAEFYDAWKQRGHNQQEFLACAYQNTIVYDTVSLAEAVDSTLSWSTGGDGNWFGEKVEFSYGGDAAQSSAITHNQNTWIKTTVSGPGTLKFYWKVSSEPNYDFLRFYIDDSEQSNPLHGTNGSWEQGQYTISSGSHELMWKYTKDVSVNAGCDCGWLDKVEWAPGSSTPTIGFSPASFSFTATQGGSNPPGQTLSIWNAGGDTLNWSVSDDANWLSLGPTSGSSTGETDTVTVSVNISGMSTGTYNATITISASGATNTPQTVPVSLTISSGGTVQKLIGPDDATTGTNGAGNVVWDQWAATSNGNVTQIRVKCNNAGNVKVAIYSDNAGSPGTLLSAVNTSTSVVAGWNTITITSTSVTSGTNYWLGFINDVGCVAYQSSTSTPRVAMAATYSTFTFPTTVSGTFNGGPCYDGVTGWGTPSDATQRLIGVATDTASTGGAGSCTNVMMQRFLANAAGTITEFKVKASSTGNVKVAIYDDSSGTPTTRRTYNDSSTPVASGWNTISIPSTPVTSSTYYWLAVVSDSCNIYYHSNDSSANTIWKPSTYSSWTWPNPAGSGWNTQPGYTYFIAGWDTPSETIQRLIGVAPDTASTGGAGSCTNVMMQRFLANATGTITEFKVKASSSGNVKVAIYADSSGQPGSLLAAVNSSTPVISGWNTIPITSTSVTSSTYYWLAVVSDSCNIYYHSNDPSANTIWKPSTYSSYTFPNPAGSGWNTQPGYTYFIAGWGVP